MFVSTWHPFGPFQRPSERPLLATNTFKFGRSGIAVFPTSRRREAKAELGLQLNCRIRDWPAVIGRCAGDVRSRAPGSNCTAPR